MKATRRDFGLGGAILAAALAGGCNLVSGLADLTVGDATTTTSSTTGGTGGTGGTTGGTGGTTGGTSTSSGGASCSNGAQDVASGETDIDCGGPCPACKLGDGCAVAADCASGICRKDPSSSNPEPQCVGVKKISAGNAHACAVLTSGELFCWGSNKHGQLGIGNLADSAAPAKVDLANVADVAAGGPPESKETAHTCALTASGALHCWGANGSGQLGAADPQDVNVPSIAPVLTGAKVVATGASFTCAIQSDDDVSCWGANLYNQLADSTGVGSSTPVLVPGLAGATAITLGAIHGCAVLPDATVSCWGNNERGQIASDMLLPAGKLTVVPTVAGASRVRGGNDFTCAIDAAGLWCWGDNLDGELTGAVAADMTFTPAMLDVPGATEIATGADGDLDPNDPRGGHACAIVPQGKVHCWGNNRSGQLGRGTTSDEEPATAEIAGLAGAVEITAGAELTCARFESGAAACWGRNDHGQVGNGQTGAAISSPVPIAWP